MATSFKKQKLEEKIGHYVNVFLRQEISDPRLQFVSVTRTELNADASVAILYWDTFDAQKRGDASAALKKTLGKMRSFLASVLQIRHVPSLVACYDAQFEAERKIESLLVGENITDDHSST